MSTFAPGSLAGLTGGLLAVFLCASTAISADGTAKEQIPIPDFSSAAYGWSAQAPNFISPPGGAHEVTNDPSHMYTRRGRGEPLQFRIADLSNPILQLWAKEELERLNQKVMAGGTGFTASASCLLLGVPEYLLSPVQPLFFIQTPKEVVMIQQMDAQVRHVYLNVPHSTHGKLSWYGESVGHYEGDTLVVDTVGLNTKTWIDNYHTPHTEKLHVVERFHLVDGGRRLEVNVQIEDPGAFTVPWNTIQRFERADDQGPLTEEPCAENIVPFGAEIPVPEADKPDF